MKTALTFLLTPWTSILRGYVISKLWAWFIVAAFGVPGIGIAIGAGLSLLVSVLTINPKVKLNESSSWWEDAFISTGISLYALGIGWVIARFI